MRRDLFALFPNINVLCFAWGGGGGFRWQSNFATIYRSRMKENLRRIIFLFWTWNTSPLPSKSPRKKRKAKVSISKKVRVSKKKKKKNSPEVYLVTHNTLKGCKKPGLKKQPRRVPRLLHTRNLWKRFRTYSGMERKELLMGVEISVKSVFIHFDVKNERGGGRKNRW